MKTQIHNLRKLEYYIQSIKQGLYIEQLSELAALFIEPHSTEKGRGQGRTDHLKTRALPKGPGSVGGPMRCP
ncbi:unnamed protein product [Staurois parvus]|uniref:Uncharacterized protein n=1 Tax=Staurois parvus TaxID=386267 RepID=A0ABN9AKK6_9NEOB|nr:unnamed protein product [Staurois parvus]